MNESHQRPVGYVSQDFLDGKWTLDHIAKTDTGQISRVIPVFTRAQPSAEPAAYEFQHEATGLAADEIERLRAENKDLRAARDRALEHIAEWLKWADTDPWANAHTVAACVAELEEVLRYPASCLRGPSHDL